MSVKSVSIRIQEEMLEKIGFVADYEGRSVNSHILVLIRENIRAFESAYGAIEENIAPDVNVKPSRKNGSKAKKSTAKAVLFRFQLVHKKDTERGAPRSESESQ